VSKKRKEGLQMLPKLKKKKREEQEQKKKQAVVGVGQAHHHPPQLQRLHIHPLLPVERERAFSDPPRKKQQSPTTFQLELAFRLTFGFL
jgi:hypothetical protein